MDSSSRNLLDLLNNKQKSDKEQLLALFAPKSAAPTKSPTIPERDASPRSTTTRSGATRSVKRVSGNPPPQRGVRTDSTAVTFSKSSSCEVR